MPKAGSSDRSALESEQLAVLLAVADPTGATNPWKDEFVRLRNWTIIELLLATGMRRGELLSLRVRDINRANAYANIVRRNDDKDDPRTRAPNVKTFERAVPLVEAVMLTLEEYILARGKIPAARKHGFLFVSTNGAPLSESSVNSIFAEIKATQPTLEKLSPHVLRHQWNEFFSEYADLLGLTEEEERRERIWLQGWSVSSLMPEYYSKRRIKREADAHQKGMQDEMMKWRRGTGTGKNDEA